MTHPIYDVDVTKLGGEETTLEEHRGKVLLIVNTASKCGLTPQYEGLEALYREHREAGLVVLGFPCNQFAGQEPGTDEEIASFCSTRFDVSFPMYGKLSVNGSDTHPLYQHLKAEQTGLLGSAIKWNFTKFLVNRQGEVVERFGPKTTPATFAEKVAALL
ncbi:MAG: glutathione peroxidase [Deltaproteobacteria bacterium]|nr:glutathione peroxidase [Deltaproteobacteria bacterium]